MTATHEHAVPSCDAVVAGHICLDIIPLIAGIAPEEFQRSFGPGRLLQVGPAALATGGPVSNTGLALHKLGVPTQLMGKIGDDLFGQAIKQIVAGFDPRLSAGMIVDPAANTSYTVVINPPGLDRTFLHCPGANDTFSAADVRYDLVAGARLFHFGYPPLMKMMYAGDGTELVEIFRRAKATGVTTSLDMALPDPASAGGRADWVRILRGTLPYVDLFLPSIEEILYMLRRDLYGDLTRAAAGGDLLPAVTPQLLHEVSDELLAMGAKVVALKLGHRGLYLRTAAKAVLEHLGRARPVDYAAWANRELWIPCFQAEVVGTTGAGDSTIAGFHSALLRDFSPEDAVTAAVAVGGCNVEAASALGSLRSWDETLRRVAEGWSRHPLVLDAPGWRFDDSKRVWRGD